MNEQQTASVISPEEDVARIINNAWVDEGVLLHSAFAFAPNETYLSVNRLSIDSFEQDVKNFVLSHPAYQMSNPVLGYQRALINVGDINGIKMTIDKNELNVKVEVEPRNVHTKSHAGIFVRTGGQNMAPGRVVKEGLLPSGVSIDMVLQKVQWELKDRAELQVCQFAES